MRSLTAIEQECRAVIQHIQMAFLSPKRERFSKQAFYEILKDINMTLTHLDNRESGCATGLHCGSCHCRPDEIVDMDELHERYFKGKKKVNK